ncbi:putative membrane protein [Enhygromyxa salina]|uniref:Putative membrane protein n=1 Tax=Enhygromyxa salina TaxID=215803 RepID=A0A0C2CX41_9BACT|nr:GDYXXLXY domain-containing protein [Enhygromyxa salina]KIG15596.1 putative membrane protein [Enhygromyxa salina]
MSDSSDALLDLPAKRGRLHALAAAGILGPAELERALTATGHRPTAKSWSAYLYWQALIIGVVLLVAGTIFFVAANWSALPGHTRMAIVGGAMLLATLGGGYLGDTLAGRAVTLLGGLLFGPLLAVYGQVYQTGADAWELFAAWTVMLIAYGALSRFVGTWVLALVCLHVAAFGWIHQELGANIYEGTGALPAAALALLDAVIVALAERFTSGRDREVIARAAAFAGLALLVPFGVVTIFERLPEGGAPGLVLLLAGLAAIWAIYRARIPDIGMLAAFASVVTLLVSTGFARVLFKDVGAELFGVTTLGVIICAQVWGFTRWLLNWRREHGPTHHPASPAPAETGDASASEREALARAETTLRELLGLIAPTQLERASTLPLADALHDSEASDAPVLVRLFTAIGTWIGAAMIATLFAAMELYRVVPLALVLGAGLFAGAIKWSQRPRRSLVVSQVIWAMALGAHGLIAGALAKADLLSDSMIAFTWMGLNIATMFLVRVPSFQLASAVCAVGFATWWALSLELPMFALWVGVPVAALATAAWIREVPWAARLGRTWTALAYGLPIGALIPLSVISVGHTWVDPTLRLGLVGPLASLTMLALIGAVVWQAKREQASALAGRAYALGAIALLLGLATRHVPGLSLALVWLLLAHLRKSRGLQTLASIQLGCFLFLFYYQLETTLLLKSLWVMSTGALLLLGAWLARPRSDETRADSGPERSSRWLPAIVLCVVSAGLVIGASLQKERVLSTGQTVLLPLAPVDPRSLMQGDYMILRYELEDELDTGRAGQRELIRPMPGQFEPDHEALEPEPPAVPALPSTLVGQPRRGRLVLTVDGDRVGHFARFDDGSPLAADELLLEYRQRNNQGSRLRVGAESFLFEEGSDDLYANARYGELVVASDGESVLVGLRDEARRPLGVPRHYQGRRSPF